MSRFRNLAPASHNMPATTNIIPTTVNAWFMRGLKLEVLNMRQDILDRVAELYVRTDVFNAQREAMREAREHSR